MNRTFLDKVICMLISFFLPNLFWGKALLTAACLVNLSPFTALNCKVPNEVWSGKKPYYSRLRIFGCVAYAHQYKGMLEPR